MTTRFGDEPFDVWLNAGGLDQLLEVASDASIDRIMRVARLAYSAGRDAGRAQAFAEVITETACQRSLALYGDQGELFPGREWGSV